MFFLRQSTASQSVLIGPFVDSTDGNTAETGLTVDAADIRLSKNGANIVGKNSGGGTHDELGYYTITLDATDTDTVGRLQLMVHESGALPVYHEFQVVEEALFDGLFAASAARVPADTTHIAGAAVSTSTAQIGVNVVNAGGTAWASGAITAAVIATGAIDADAIADNAIDAGAIATGAITAAKFGAGAIDAAAVATGAIDADALAADAVAEIQAGLSTLTASGLLTTALADAYAANGAAPTLQQAVMAIHQVLMDFAISGTSNTVKKLDGTTAFTVTLDSATAPTSASRD